LGEPRPPEMIEIAKAEYQRLVACRTIVDKGLAELGS
jgi:hypothetical protein